MTAGRNDLCPCGSGKKFKKCCWGKSQAATTQPLAAPSRPPGPTQLVPPRRNPAPAPPAARPKPPPRVRTPAEEKWEACWTEFEAQEGEGRIAVFLQALDDKELMTDEGAFELLIQLHQDCVKRGVRVRFAELVESLRQRQPEVYQKEAHYFLSWMLLDALAESRLDVVPALARELAARAGRDIDVVNQSLSLLAYYGQLTTLVEA